MFLLRSNLFVAFCFEYASGALTEVQLSGSRQRRGDARIVEGREDARGFSWPLTLAEH
jgi:hypothetical protein